MKTKHYFISILIILFTTNLELLALEKCYNERNVLTAFGRIPKKIAEALNNGDAEMLANFFNTNVELVILDKEDVYSKVQAELILRDFFEKFKPQKFEIIHEGGKDGASYAIGKLETQNGTFRVYFLLKKMNGEPYIHQLRIEKENE